MVFDFSFPANIPREYVALYNQIAADSIEDFHRLVYTLSLSHGQSIDWWVEGPSSRNTYASPLYHYCCCIKMLEKLCMLGENIEEIRVDSARMKSIVKQYGKKCGLTIPVIMTRQGFFKKIFRPFVAPLREIFFFLRLYRIAKKTVGVRRPLPAVPLTVIDTFVFDSGLDDRYYDGLWEQLTCEEQKAVFFVPHFYSPSSLVRLLKGLRTSPKNYLLKEDFLHVSDYWYALTHGWRILKIRYQKVHFCGVDISPLVKEEILSFRGYSMAFISLLNYLFFFRMYEAGIKIRVAVDWFENQVFDRGWNKGLNTFYPDAKTIGYKGYVVSPYYLCSFPTQQEKELGLLPKEICTMSSGLVQSVRRFCLDLEVSVCPSFRFRHAWESRTFFPDKEYVTILVALPMSIREGNELLEIVAHVVPHLANINSRFLIKSHPLNAPETIERMYPGTFPSEFTFTRGSFNECVERANVLVSCASSSSIHALMKGVPVIIIGSQRGLTHNPVPEDFSKDLWNVCYNTDDVLRCIRQYQRIDPQDLLRRSESNRDYFVPVNRETVVKFLKLGNLV